MVSARAAVCAMCSFPAGADSSFCDRQHNSARGIGQGFVAPAKNCQKYEPAGSREVREGIDAFDRMLTFGREKRTKKQPSMSPIKQPGMPPSAPCPAPMSRERTPLMNSSASAPALMAVSAAPAPAVPSFSFGARTETSVSYVEFGISPGRALG